jgi:hypothetical protein
MQGMADDVGARPPLGGVITRSDMYFHQPRYRDYRWLETNAFTFTVPAAHMRGHIRSAFRTNLGVVESSIMVFSSGDRNTGAFDCDYTDVRHHVPIPPQNLDRYDLLSGLSVRMTKPLEEWTLRYDGAYDTVFDLHLRALMPPLHICETGTKDEGLATIRLGHLDQMMHVCGNVRIRGTDHAVDWPAWRDHSWSPRPESSSGYGTPISANFDYGSFGDSLSFFVQTRNEWESIDRGIVHNGYLLDNGTLLRLKAGEGRYKYDDRWIITALEYELEDERGRTHLFVGEPRGFCYRGSVNLACVRWRTSDGEVGWGEYDWHGDAEHLRNRKPPSAQ